MGRGAHEGGNFMAIDHKGQGDFHCHNRFFLKHLLSLIPGNGIGDHLSQWCLGAHLCSLFFLIWLAPAVVGQDTLKEECDGIVGDYRAMIVLLDGQATRDQEQQDAYEALGKMQQARQHYLNFYPSSPRAAEIQEILLGKTKEFVP